MICIWLKTIFCLLEKTMALQDDSMVAHKKPKVFLPGVKVLLLEVRAPHVTPEMLLSNGQEAGDFALEYVRRHALRRFQQRQRQLTNNPDAELSNKPKPKRGRPKKTTIVVPTTSKKPRGRPKKKS
jgi:hypothetical protein